MAKKEKIKNEVEGLMNEYRVQFEQSLCELIVAHRRIEYLAYRSLTEEEYKKMCKNVSDFVKKICTVQ